MGWREDRIAYEKGLLARAKSYVRNEMSDTVKDNIFKIAQATPSNFELLKKNKNYKQLRDDFVARDLFAIGLSYEVPIEQLVQKNFIDKYVKGWNDTKAEEQYRNNALKALSTRYKNEYNMILSYLQTDKLDPDQLIYLGSDVYTYANGMVVISFQRSPEAVEVRFGGVY